MRNVLPSQDTDFKVAVEWRFEPRETDPKGSKAKKQPSTKTSRNRFRQGNPTISTVFRIHSFVKWVLTFKNHTQTRLKSRSPIGWSLSRKS